MNARLVAAVLLWAAVFPARAARLLVEPSAAPRADASVLAALGALRSGESTLDVIVGLREDASSDRRARHLAAPRRLEAQRRVLAAMRPGTVTLRRHYTGFPAFTVRATRKGVLALANRKDVAWVTLDAIRYRDETEPQPAQLLIRSSDANARGFDGTGQTIAIIDTGVDYSLPALGGGTFPGAKVVAGADLGDDDADPMDCLGHGTSVALVAAGPGGVAPSAQIVALKIARNTDCETALDSDILAAIDWVLAHRDELDIGVVNLSFGSTPFDGLDHGFCDAELPQYVTAVGALNAAGVVFTSSAGNEAVTNAISAPACLSTALSAGAVYPDFFSSVSWGGASEFCADHSVAPDSVVCFSNSASTLAFLAPGAFWRVEAAGGAVEEFHGTSAAAPAVAGAAALLRQARPGLTPSSLASLLRATGKPVADDRNGVLTPRIDILAAIDLPDEAFGAFDGTPVPMPDGAAAAGRRPRASRDSRATSRASPRSSRSSTTTRGSSSWRSGAPTARASSCTRGPGRRAGPSTRSTAERSVRRSRSERFRAGPPTAPGPSRSATKSPASRGASATSRSGSRPASLRGRFPAAPPPGSFRSSAESRGRSSSSPTPACSIPAPSR